MKKISIVCKYEDIYLFENNKFKYVIDTRTEIISIFFFFFKSFFLFKEKKLVNFFYKLLFYKITEIQNIRSILNIQMLFLFILNIIFASFWKYISRSIYNGWS